MAADDREARWDSFTEEECATIALGLCAAALDAVFGVINGEPMEPQRRDEMVMCVAELMDSMGPRMGNDGIDKALMARMREAVDE